ncbi:MAG: hypothetical protein VB084_16430 [Syntrophomonadaceae bacterium]|nr:hypothetical protein [Syntrophomonadaceae bacterium]
MIISGSSVALTGRSTYSESYRKQETLQIWADSSSSPGNTKLQNIDILDLSEEGQYIKSSVNNVDGAQDIDVQLSDKDKQKILLLQKFLESITGKKIKFVLPEKIRLNNTDLRLERLPQTNLQSSRQGWGIIYSASEQYIEHESMSFAAQGLVKTADGREISIGLELNVSRDFAYSSNINFRAGDAVKVDPLVINLDTPSASLTETKFAFDLDADGTAENISFVGPGSGFIALDQNNDGIINDGSELFGTRSGDGFKDLAAYDTDNNGWIDENDPIYDKLRIWTKNEAGQDVLLALGQKGVGAIFLGSAATNFSLKDAGNQLNGEISKTGIYLNEDGTAGTIQHVDLVV